MTPPRLTLHVLLARIGSEIVVDGAIVATKEDFKLAAWAKRIREADATQGPGNVATIRVTVDSATVNSWFKTEGSG